MSGWSLSELVWIVLVCVGMRQNLGWSLSELVWIGLVCVGMRRNLEAKANQTREIWVSIYHSYTQFFGELFFFGSINFLRDFIYKI